MKGAAASSGGRGRARCRQRSTLVDARLSLGAVQWYAHCICMALQRDAIHAYQKSGAPPTCPERRQLRAQTLGATARLSFLSAP